MPSPAPLPAPTSLAGQVAIISGGLGDIGRAIALDLASQGVHIAVGDVLPAECATELLAELAALGVRARYDHADVADPDAVDAWLSAVAADLGTPTLIIPNAAIVALHDVRTLTPADWRRELGVNLDGAFYLAHGGATRLLAAGLPGRIVFVGSWAGHAPHRHIPTYCVSKAGLRMLMQQLALDLAADNILVNEVAPGYVDAGLSGRLFDENPGSRDAARSRVPTRTLITADEVAAQVRHLCEPANRHTTGSVLLMDGGLSLLRGHGEA